MSDIINLDTPKEGIPEEPTLTPEEELEREIEKQDDAVQIQARSVNDPFQNILYTAVQSQKLGKKVVTYFKYVEETENGKVIARSMQGGEKQIHDFADEVNMIEPVIIRQRPIVRG